MKLTNTILKKVIKDCNSNNLDLPQDVNELANILNNYLPSYIDSADFAKQVLPNSLGVLTSQKISVTLTQLDDKLSPLEETKIEVNSICIEDINLDLKATGFSGNMAINLPYSTLVPESYGILFESQPLQVDLIITTEYRQDQTNPAPKEKSINNTVTLKGITSLKQGIRHQHQFLDDDQQILDSNKPFFRSYVSIQFDFYDALQAFWDEHYNVCIYQDKSYQDVFNDQNKTYESLVKLTLDDSAKLFKTVRPTITMNCDYQKKFSFYDFLVSVLYDYGLSLFYDYAKQEYHIIDAKTWFDKLTKIELDTKKSIRLSQVNMTNSKPLRSLQIFDTNYNIGNTLVKPSEINKIWNEKSSGLPEISTSYLTSSGVEKTAESIKETQDINKQYIYNKTGLDINSPVFSQGVSIPVEITSQIAPLYDCSFLPVSLVKFSEKIKDLTYKKQGLPELLLLHTSFQIKPTPIWENIRKFWTGTQEHFTFDNKHDLSRTIHDNDNIKTRPALLFNYETTQSFSFKDSVNIILPRKVKVQPVLDVIAEIYTTSDDESEKSHNHLLFDLDQNKVTTMTAKQKSDVYSAGMPNSPFIQSYLCKFPKTLLPPTLELDPFLIPVNMLEFNALPNFYTLLKSGTQVQLQVERESIHVYQVLNYQVPEQVFCEGDKQQNHYLNFEDRVECKAYISHEYDLSAKTTSLNIESTQPDKTRSIVLSDKGLKMKYQLKP